jgi:hypothetical protein
MTKLTVKDPSGKVHTRTTKRTYTHVVFARQSRDWHLKDAQSRPYHHTANFWYHKAFVDGTSKWLERHGWESEEQHKKRVEQDVKRAKYCLRGCETPDELWELIKVEQMEAFEKIDFDKWHVMGWCGRLDLAQKLAVSDCWTDNTIVAVD